MSQYLPKAEFSRMLVEAQAAGRVTDELSAAVVQLAEGVWHRYVRRWQIDRDEFVQTCLVQVCTSVLARIDPDKNPFSYCTSSCLNVGRQMARTRNRHASWESLPPEA